MPRSTGGRNARDYRESDVRIVLTQRGQWRRWNDVARWLHSSGKNDPELKPSDAMKMLGDIDNLIMDEVPYTDEPGAAFKLMREHRTRAPRGHHRREMWHRQHGSWSRV